jgi:hypothetical protein
LPVISQDGIAKANYVHVQVMSGQLYAPKVPVVAENAEMQKTVDTYGKIWHLWQIDRGDKLPLGERPAVV